MNVFSEVDIRCNKGSNFIFQAIIEFCKSNKKWHYDKIRSEEYTLNLLNSKGCIIIHNQSKFVPALALCEKKNGHVYIANIIPQKLSEIPLNNYNQLSREFFEDFKKFQNTKKLRITLSISKTDLELKDIITANIPRKNFEKFLNRYPLSYHPNDIKNLDTFICSVSSFSRKKINLPYLGEYLREKMKWPESNIQWCLNRIETGLEILKVKKRY